MSQDKTQRIKSGAPTQTKEPASDQATSIADRKQTAEIAESAEVPTQQQESLTKTDLDPGPSEGRLIALESVLTAMTARLQNARDFLAKDKREETDPIKLLDEVIRSAQRPTKINIEQRFDPGFDPDRVLEVVKRDIAKLATQRLSGDMVALFVGDPTQVEIRQQFQQLGAEPPAKDSFEALFQRYLARTDLEMSAEDRPNLLRLGDQLARLLERVKLLTGAAGAEIARTHQSIRMLKTTQIHVAGGLTHLSAGDVIACPPYTPQRFKLIMAQLRVDPTCFEPYVAPPKKPAPAAQVTVPTVRTPLS